jgi:Family of unknown function (DUF5361)
MARGRRVTAGGIPGLIKLLREHRSAIESDLISLGLRLRDVGTPEFTFHDLYVICENSNRSSALARSIHGTDLAWTLDNHLLASQLDALNLLLWQKTKDGHKNKNRPKPIDRPGVKTTEKTTGTPMSIEDAEKWLQARGAGME